MVNDYFYHERNIARKIRDNYKSIGKDFKNFKTDIYDPYKNQQLAINGITKEDVNQKVNLLNNYYKEVSDFLKKFLTSKEIKAQSKFRSTIIEEFCGYLFKDIATINKLGLDFFNKKVYTGITLNNRGNPNITTKDIDFCIGKKINAKLDTVDFEIILPLIAIECKTYIDKTMLGEALYTSQLIKKSSPLAKCFVLTEENQIGKESIPFRGQTSLDGIFVIEENGIIKTEVTYEFFKQVAGNILRLEEERILKKVGNILQE